MAETPASSLLVQAEQAWQAGDGAAAMELFDRAALTAEADHDLDGHAAAVLGLARGQRYNLSPGLLAVRLHALYTAADETALRARLAAALARCWAYANEARRAQPFALESLHLADRLDDPVLQADALDAVLAAHWGPDDLAQRREWAIRLDDVVAHLGDHDARLTATLWGLTVAWELLDLTRIHRFVHALEVLADGSPRAEFFAASRRLPVELLRGNWDVLPLLVQRAASAAEQAVIPDSGSVLHAMRGYGAYVTGDAAGCAAEALAYEDHAVTFGVAAVRAEAAVVWAGAGRPDKVAAMIGAFTPAVLAGLPKDSDWMLTMQCVLEGALTLRDREIAAATVAQLAPYAGRSVVNAGGVMWHGVTDDTLGRAYAMLGDDDAASRHRSAALATYERVGATWWLDRLRAELPHPQTRTDEVAGKVAVHLHQQPGGLWLVGREGATFVLPAMRGLSHLQALLLCPDTDVPALRLSGDRTVEQPGLEVIDDASRRVLGARLAELDAELADHELPALRDERSAILAYLGGGRGLGGRTRSTGSHAERARIAVRKAVVAALAAIAEVDPWLGRHLRDHVHTGLQCRYESDPDHPVRWILRPTGDVTPRTVGRRS